MTIDLSNMVYLPLKCQAGSDVRYSPPENRRAKPGIKGEAHGIQQSSM